MLNEVVGQHRKVRTADETAAPRPGLQAALTPQQLERRLYRRPLQCIQTSKLGSPTGDEIQEYQKRRIGLLIETGESEPQGSWQTYFGLAVRSGDEELLAPFNEDGLGLYDFSDTYIGTWSSFEEMKAEIGGDNGLFLCNSRDLI